MKYSLRGRACGQFRNHANCLSAKEPGWGIGALTNNTLPNRILVALLLSFSRSVKCGVMDIFFLSSIVEEDFKVQHYEFLTLFSIPIMPDFSVTRQPSIPYEFVTLFSNSYQLMQDFSVTRQPSLLCGLRIQKFNQSINQKGDKFKNIKIY